MSPYVDIEKNPIDQVYIDIKYEKNIDAGES
jgi:hypothetical protein